jgi:3-oxoacyl-[acyl-carrier-protein] synthase-3
MFARILDVDFYLPEIHELSKILKPEHFKKIYPKSGIKNIAVSSSSQSALDLAVKATKNIIKKKYKIDGIIYVSQSPEYYLPSSSCILQDRLGLSKNIFTFDLNQGCSGYIYGLCLASSLIKNLIAENILLICADTYSKYISKTNLTCLPIFSDAASATVVTKSRENFFIDFQFGTDGSGYKDLIVKNSGFHANSSKPEIFMDGKKILLFTMTKVPELINDILDRNNLTIKQIDYFIFHQASKIVIENLVRKMNLEKSKVYFNIEKIGNTVSSSIPIAIYKLIKKKRLKKNSKILLVGFGVGLSMGATIINWR